MTRCHPAERSPDCTHCKRLVSRPREVQAVGPCIDASTVRYPGDPCPMRVQVYRAKRWGKR